MKNEIKLIIIYMYIYLKTAENENNNANGFVLAHICANSIFQDKPANDTRYSEDES